MSPRRLLPVLLTALLAPAGTACGGGGTGPADALPAALVGTWQASAACKSQGCAITGTVPGSGSLDLTSRISMQLELRASGGVYSTITASGLAPATAQGVGRVRGSTLLVDYAGGAADTITFATQGPVLHLDFQNQVTAIDVTGDGKPDPLRISVALVRQ